jgi:hypothetical protein
MQASAAKIPPQVVGSESIISAKPNERLTLDLDDIVSSIFVGGFCRGLSVLDRAFFYSIRVVILARCLVPQDDR